MIFSLQPESIQSSDFVEDEGSEFLMFKLDKVFDEFDRQGLFLLIDQCVLLATLFLIESEDSILVKRIVDCLLQKLDNGLFFAESARQYFDDSGSQTGINVGLDVESGEVLKVT